MIFNNYKEIEIGGKNYKLKYTVKALHAVERDLSSGNILVLLRMTEQNIPPNMTDMYVMFKHAFLAGNPGRWSEEDVEDIYLTAVNEKSVVELLQLCLTALKISGVMGRQTDLKKAEAAQA